MPSNQALNSTDRRFSAACCRTFLNQWTPVASIPSSIFHQGRRHACSGAPMSCASPLPRISPLLVEARQFMFDNDDHVTSRRLNDKNMAIRDAAVNLNGILLTVTVTDGRRAVREPPRGRPFTSIATSTQRGCQSRRFHAAMQARRVRRHARSVCARGRSRRCKQSRSAHHRVALGV